MKIWHDREHHTLVLESENESEYWHLSALSKDGVIREKENYGETIKLTFHLRGEQDHPTR